MPPAPAIRPLDPVADLDAVHGFYQAAPDYWLLADRIAPDAAKAAAFFTDGPPRCDPARSFRLGLFLGDRLSGVAELSFGFPDPQDAYLGLMMLGGWAQGAGHGAVFLRHVEGLARQSGAQALCLAVLQHNPRGWAFWQREGFVDTGLSGEDIVQGHRHVLHRLRKDL